MKIYALDANALIRYLTNTPGADKVEELIRRARNGEAKLIVSVVNRGEALYILTRTRGFDRTAEDLRALSRFIESIDADEAQSEAAALLKMRYKLGLGDSYAAALAIRFGATLVTADPEFARLGKQLKILALPRHSV
ncbi:MAG: PIN domain-containing protein [Terracidiphilus sp.]